MDTLVNPTLEDAYDAINSGTAIQFGSYRIVHYNPDNPTWVYKVDRPGTLVGGNEEEYDAYLLWKDRLPKGISIPEMYMLPGNILAARYIEGESPSRLCHVNFHRCDAFRKCFWYKYGKALQTVSGDANYGNILITPEDKVFVIDLGHSMRKTNIAY